MIISLIGMSGSGKSYWSKQLENEGFKRICCDDLIEQQLSEELTKLGYSGIADVSKWMGQPYEKKYKQTSKKYLEIEENVMQDIISQLNEAKNLIIDTTGSVIYINQHLLKKLKTKTRMIYLKVPQEVEDDMFKLYLEDPKPVIWGNSFNQRSSESNSESLKRCYPDLLKYRSKQYAKLAKITVDYFKLRTKDFNAVQFLELIK